MNAHLTKTAIRRMLDAVLAAPAVLRAYAVFAIAVTLADFALLSLAPESFRASIVPYIGWLASGTYAFTIFFTFAITLQPKSRGATRFLGITCMLLIQIAHGIFTLSLSGRPNFGNPYLTVNPWQPVWTIFIPLFWIALLHLPAMNRFCRKTHEPNAA